ncbi:MAG TPA: zinc ribbon domain-containing protein [Propionibacteriaceae bacterium]|nr:zinc ribbon domain-containing protein [Propionibacteriaceae bacterium]
MFCTRCGSPVTPDDHACPTCGGNLLLPGSVGVDDETPTMTGGSARSVGGAAATAGGADVDGPGSTRIMPAVGGHDDLDATRFNPRVPAQEPPRAPRPATSNLPDDWFRSEDSAPPPRPASWAGAPQPPLVDPAPGQPPVPTQRRYHERMSAGVVAALALIPVVAIAILVWQLLQWGGVRFVSPPAHTAAAGTTPIPSGATEPSGATSAAPQASSSSAPASSAASAASSSSAAVPAGATQCSATVYAGPDTSCPFAQAVAAKIPAHPHSVFEVTAKSPVTKKDYKMSCTSGTPIVCRGGDNAVVYVTG